MGSSQVRCLLFALAFCAAPVFVQGQQPFVRGSDVSFTIRTDQHRYQVGDTILIRYTVKNVSNGAFFVPKKQWDIRCGDPPHVWARIENSSGEHYEPGYGGSCLGSSRFDKMSVTERMHLDAVLLKPGQSMSGSFELESKVLGHLRPGPYRLEAVLYGWGAIRRFSDSELSELDKMGAPFLLGEAHSVSQIELSSAGKP